MGFWEVVSWSAWCAGFLNVIAMALQLKTLIKTRETKSVSLWMYSIFTHNQIVFCFVGYHKQEWGLFFGMLGSVVITMTIIGLVRRWRQDRVKRLVAFLQAGEKDW